MAIIMIVASSRKVMGKFVIPPYLRSLGWIATAVMFCVGAGVFLTWKQLPLSRRGKKGKGEKKGGKEKAGRGGGKW